MGMSYFFVPRMNIGLFGFGTVGSGVAHILFQSYTEILKKNGISLHLQKICTQNVAQIHKKGIPEALFTEDANDIFLDPTIDTIVEVIGGTTVAKHIIQTALQAKKNVVTANKAVLAEHGEELCALASKNGVRLLYEASVGGGIPILKILREYYSAGNITKVSGIVNGTCNYILSELEKGGKTYEEILKEAQALGFAEADPTFDVEGFDSAQKLSILTALAFGTHFPYWKNIPRSGISNLLPSDFAFAKKIGRRIRLIARAEKTEHGIYYGVHPRLVPENSRLGSITGAENSIVIEDPFFGIFSMVGAGAGSLPTATAIVADIAEIALGNMKFFSSEAFEKREKFVSGPREEIKKQTYFRVKIKDEVGVVASITKVFAKNGISIAEIQNGNADFPMAFLLHSSPLVAVERSAEEIARFSFVLSAPVILMVEE